MYNKEKLFKYNKLCIYFREFNSNYARIMRQLYKVQNTVKINKNMKKYLLYNTILASQRIV